MFVRFQFSILLKRTNKNAQIAETFKELNLYHSIEINGKSKYCN